MFSRYSNLTNEFSVLGLLGTSSRKVRGYAEGKGAEEDAADPGESLEHCKCQYDAPLPNDGKRIFFQESNIHSFIKKKKIVLRVREERAALIFFSIEPRVQWGKIENLFCTKKNRLKGSEKNGKSLTYLKKKNRPRGQRGKVESHFFQFQGVEVRENEFWERRGSEGRENKESEGK